MAPSIVLHHAIPTRSCRIAWLLEELGVPYKLRPVDFPKELWTDEYKQANPVGLLPFMEDGDVKMNESVAIMTYLLERHGEGKLAPSMEVDPKARAEFIMVRPAMREADTYAVASGTAQMMQVMEAGVTAPAGVFGMNAVMLPEHMRNAVLAENGKKQLQKYLPLLESRMGDGRKYIAGDEFTAADIVAGQGLNLVQIIGFMDAEKYPKLAELLKTLQARPAFAKIFSPAKEE